MAGGVNACISDTRQDIEDGQQATRQPMLVKTYLDLCEALIGVIPLDLHTWLQPPGGSAFSSSKCMLDWGPTGTCQSGMTGKSTSCASVVAAATLMPLSWEEWAAALKLDVAGGAKAPAVPMYKSAD